MRKLLLVICSVVLVFCCYNICKYFYQSIKNNHTYDQIIQVYHSKSDTKDIQIDLTDINENIKAWIQIPGTRIDYPVVQGEDNQYYLDHDINHNQSKHGAIFIDYRNCLGEDKNIIIYGHNMRDGSMFEDLNKFRDKQFFNKNKYIYLDTGGEKICYQVFSVYVTQPTTDYLVPDFKSQQEYAKFFDKIKQRSLFDADVSFSGNEDMITLSTCAYDFKDAKLAVHGIKIANKNQKGDTANDQSFNSR